MHGVSFPLPSLSKCSPCLLLPAWLGLYCSTFLRASIPETSKPSCPARMTCSFSESWQAAFVLCHGKWVNPFPPFLLLSPSPCPVHLPAGNWMGGMTEEEMVYFYLAHAGLWLRVTGTQPCTHSLRFHPSEAMRCNCCM